VDDLAGLIQLLLDFCLGTVQPSLAEIDRVSEEGTSRLDATGIAAVLKADSFDFEEFPQVIVKLIFIDLSHKRHGCCFLTCRSASPPGSAAAITEEEAICKEAMP
jgi:hypothetical protein